MAMAENQNINIHISSGSNIQYRIGDNPFTDICDYMDTCHNTCSPMKDIKPEELIQDTYNYDFVKMNNDIIIDKIRNLFREQNIYKKNVLINSINIVKQYPIEQIYNALTYMIYNKNEFIYDKYGRMGNLVNKGEYYTFQPVEITDENASIYEKTAPLEYKREYIQFELPKTKEEMNETNEYETPTIEKGSETNDETNNEMEEKLEIIMKNMDIVFSDEKVMIGSGEKNWYKHANHVFNHLNQIYGVSKEDMERYVVEHILDMFSFSEKFNMIQNIENGENGEKIKELVKNYFNERIIEESGRKAIVLNKDDSWKLFVKNPENKWEEGEPEDYKFFNLERFKIDKSKLGNIIGFINMFKKRDMVFKIKDVSQSRNNIGARCGDSTTKTDVIKLLNQFLNKNAYNTNSEIYHFGFCVIIEVLMRHYTNIGKTNEKGQNIYFLTPEETAINNIAKFSRV